MFLIKFFISLVILFNISCWLHFQAAKKVCDLFSVSNANSKIKSMRGILRINFIIILAFFLFLFIDYLLSIAEVRISGLADLISALFLLSLFVSTVFLFFKLNKAGIRRSLVLTVVNVLLFPIGFYEYALADYYKQLIIPDSNSANAKNIKKVLLQKFNTYNLFGSLVLTVLLFCFMLTVTESTEPQELFYISIFSLIVLVRTFGRSIEIIYSFYKDATKPYIKTSSLTNADRLQLAIKSFFELLIVFSGVYCVLGQQFIIDYMFDFRYSLPDFSMRYVILALIDSFKNGTIIGADFVLSSNSLQLPINQFARECAVAVAVILQTLTNLVLTLFSIARYTINDGDES